MSAEAPVPIVDARGLSCPMPIVKTAQAVKDRHQREPCRGPGHGPGSVKDVQAWCRTTGNELVEQRTDDQGVFRFLIRRK